VQHRIVTIWQSKDRNRNVLSFFRGGGGILVLVLNLQWTQSQICTYKSSNSGKMGAAVGQHKSDEWMNEWMNDEWVMNEWMNEWVMNEKPKNSGFAQQVRATLIIINR
jgi:hypothetical protein